MTTLKQRFQRLRELRPEISQADLARATGAKPPSVNAWFTGETKSMKAETAAKAAAVYGVNPHWLATGDGPMLSMGTNAQEKATPSGYSNVTLVNNYPSASGPRRVPVLGAARAGENGHFEEVRYMNGAQGLVQSYSADVTAYALQVKGDPFFPAIRDGWFMVIEPNKAAAPGDMVLLTLVTGETLVMELIMTRHDGITAVGVNGEPRKSYGFDELDRKSGMRRIACLAPPSAWQAE